MTTTFLPFEYVMTNEASGSLSMTRAAADIARLIDG